MTTTARLCRLTGAALLATVLVAPGVAHADPEHRSDEAASHQPSNKPSANPTPPGQDKRANPTPPGQTKDKPAPGKTADPGAAHRSSQAPAKPANGDPAGNNGTIKIDYPAPADSGNANRPHPGCSFQLRMFNFDDDQYGALTITGQAPTSTGTLLTRRILLSSDPAGGGQDVDEVYSFTAAQLGLLSVPRGNQGWHIKVAVDAENAPGGAKQKVLWLDCPVEDEAAPALAPRAIVQRPAALRPAVVTAELAPEQPMGEATIESQSQSRPALLRFLGAGGGIRSTAAALPFTGFGAMLLLGLGTGAVVLGAMAVAASRRRTIGSDHS